MHQKIEVKITNNNIHDCSKQALFFRNLDLSSVEVSENEISNCKSGIDLEAIIDTCNNSQILIKKNKIHRNQANGVVI